MSKDGIGEIERTELLEHPAVRAWSRLQPEEVKPTGVVALQEKRKARTYQLKGVGPDGSAIIAKRSVAAKGSVERTIYEQILPHLPLTSVRYFGSVDDGEFVWIFLQFVEGDAYSAGYPAHRALAGQWLGLLHTASAHIEAATRLPDRRPGHYLAHLQLSRERIRQNLSNPAFSLDDRRFFKRLALQCDLLESNWSEVERVCALMPSCLIHGDFAPKNMKVSAGDAGTALRVFDWGTAGWGSPAADLVQSTGPSDRYWVSPDLDVYLSMTQKNWPHLHLDDVHALANVGKVFRALSCIEGDSKNLDSQWIERTVAKIRAYEVQLTEAMQALGFAVNSLGALWKETDGST